MIHSLVRCYVGLHFNGFIKQEWGTYFIIDLIVIIHGWYTNTHLIDFAINLTVIKALWGAWFAYNSYVAMFIARSPHQYKG